MAAVRSRGLKARRARRGQHFLDPAWAARVVESIQPTPADRVLEIGPGLGALTRLLAGKAAAVRALEVDRALVERLRADALPNVEVIEGDALVEDFASLVHDWPLPARLVGNLPYYIASPLLIRAIQAAADGARFSDAVFMLQAEVAARITSRPGSRDYGPLSVAVQLHAHTASLLALPPGAFRPAPQVRSTVVQLRFRAAPVAIEDPALFDAVVRAMFTRRRKTALNALRPFAERRGASAAEALSRAGIDARRRPETLDLAEFAVLTAMLAADARRTAARR